MQHVPPLERALRVYPEAIEWLRALPLSGEDEDIREAHDTIEWLESLDLGELSADASEALAHFADIYEQARYVEATTVDPDAIAFLCRLTLMALVAARAAAERDDDSVDDRAEPAMSARDFALQYIAPITAEARQLTRTLQRRYRVPHGRVRGARGRGHRRARRSAARAAGVRSGSDPGDPEPAGSSRVAVVA